MSDNDQGSFQDGATKATLESIQLNCAANVGRIEKSLGRLFDEVNGVARGMSGMKASQVAQQETLIALGGKVDDLTKETAEARGGRKALSRAQKAGIAGIGAGGAGLLLLLQVVVRWVFTRVNGH